MWLRLPVLLALVAGCNGVFIRSVEVSWPTRPLATCAVTVQNLQSFNGLIFLLFLLLRTKANARLAWRWDGPHDSRQRSDGQRHQRVRASARACGVIKEWRIFHLLRTPLPPTRAPPLPVLPSSSSARSCSSSLSLLFWSSVAVNVSTNPGVVILVLP